MKHSTASKVIVVGATNLDIVATANRGLKVDDSTPGAVRFTAGGVGRNIAEGLSRLSVDCCFYSVVGDDTPGEMVLDMCRSAGLSVDRVVSCRDERTPVYVSINENTGTMRHAVSDMSLIDHSNMEQFPTLKDDIVNSDLCVIDANLPVALIEQIARHCRDTPVAAEAVSVSKCQKLSEVLSAVSLLKANFKEAAQLAGVGENTSVEQIARALLRQGPSAVLITLGADGVMAASLNNEKLLTQFVSAPEARLVSINGAGDALLAGFIAARLSGLDLQGQLQWGAEAARLSLQSTNACSELLTREHLDALHHD